MRRISITVLVFLMIISLRCNKESSNSPDVSLVEVITITDQAGTKFHEFAAQTDGDPQEALELTRDWVLAQETVEDAMIQDTSYLRIKLKSGLLTSFYYDEIDDSGISIFRGGSKGTLARLSAINENKTCSNEISNKGVLIYAAAFTQFYKGSPYLEGIAKIYTDADEDFNVTILKDKECTVDLIETFGDYGMVIIDSHGHPDGFLLGYILNLAPYPTTEEEVRELIREQAGEDVVDMLMSGDIGYHNGSRIKTGIPNWYETNEEKTTQNLWVTTKYLDKMAEWPNTVILGNMCYSAANKVNNPQFYSMPLIRTAFMNRKLISYYGYAHDNEYSNIVTDGLCKMMEDSLSRALVADGDSTGIAHLKADKTEFKDTYVKKLYFKHFIADNYCFGFCGKDLVDQRDGKTYKTVCISDQVWMAENLDYEVSGSACYDYLEANCSEYGQLYTWDMVMNNENSSSETPSGVRGICPEGWHIPSDPEWQNLIVALGGENLAGGALKALEGWQSPNTGADNTSGFTALPGGSATWLFSGFLEKGRQASFWSSTESSGATEQAFPRTIFYNSQNVNRVSRHKNDGLSLRCVKD